MSSVALNYIFVLIIFSEELQTDSIEHSVMPEPINQHTVFIWLEMYQTSQLATSDRWG